MRMISSLRGELSQTSDKNAALEEQLLAAKEALQKYLADESAANESAAKESKDVAAAKYWQKEAKHLKGEVAKAQREVEQTRKEAQADVQRLEQHADEAAAKREEHWRAVLERKLGSLTAELERSAAERAEEIKACRHALRHIDVESGGYRGLLAGTPPPPLLDQLVRLQDKHLGLEFAVEKTRKELSATTETLEELKGRMHEVQESTRSRLKQKELNAKVERAVLVNAALGSLQQLRSHLTLALKNTPCKPGEADKFVWNGIKQGWGVESEGRFGELVVKLDLNGGQDTQRTPTRPWQAKLRHGHPPPSSAICPSPHNTDALFSTPAPLRMSPSVRAPDPTATSPTAFSGFLPVVRPSTSGSRGDVALSATSVSTTPRQGSSSSGCVPAGMDAAAGGGLGVVAVPVRGAWTPRG